MMMRIVNVKLGSSIELLLIDSVKILDCFNDN